MSDLRYAFHWKVSSLVRSKFESLLELNVLRRFDEAEVFKGSPNLLEGIFKLKYVAGHS